ncbi:MAG: hypothetical protein Q9182_006855 [Xanthomendoza sp. 2 TL-2023]
MENSFPRRSHPSLHHLSLHPLTSSLPPTPTSPTLPPTTPSSYISPATLPPTTYPSILSRSPSRTRPSSAVRTPTLDPTEPTTSPRTKSHPTSRHHSRRGTATETSAYDPESSWLTRTASTLALQSLEEKGQGWLARRMSATTPLNHQDPAGSQQHYMGAFEPAGGENKNDDDDDDGVKRKVSIRSTPSTSRYGSRVHSRAGSRLDLRMTATPAGKDSVLRPQGYDGPAAGKEWEDVEPDFVDLDEGDCEGEEEGVVDEGEMRRLVLGRVGGWVEWMVGWMDLRGDGEEEEEEVCQIERTNGVKGGGAWRLVDDGELGEAEPGARIPAPESGAGVWVDAKWLLMIAAESL